MLAGETGMAESMVGIIMPGSSRLDQVEQLAKITQNMLELAGNSLYLNFTLYNLTFEGVWRFDDHDMMMMMMMMMTGNASQF